MPCYRCGARETDPVGGPSAWRRGVRERAQVLICPGCQRGRDWTADLDRCPRCGSTALARTLGETGCRQCGASPVAPVPGGNPESVVAAAAPIGRAPAPAVAAGRPIAPVPPDRAGLAADVAAALDRFFGRVPTQEAPAAEQP